MKVRRKKLQTTLNIGGKLITAVTVTGLARILGKSRNTILRYESTDVFPQAPLLYKGVRYYPLTLANKLVEKVQELPTNRKPPAELIHEIHKLFIEERNYLCQLKNQTQK